MINGFSVNIYEVLSSEETDKDKGRVLKGEKNAPQRNMQPTRIGYRCVMAIRGCS